MKSFFAIIPGIAAALFLFSCSASRQLARSAEAHILNDPALQTAHVGISVFEPAAGKYWYNHQGDKYFVPASNTKIPTCYAAMKYLGDSLVGVRYTQQNNMLTIQGAADPSFLHPDFPSQPVYDFLKRWEGPVYYCQPSAIAGWGNGWSWNDYDQSYMAEKSALPMYGNVVRFRKLSSAMASTDTAPAFNIDIIPNFFDGGKLIVNTNWSGANGFAVERPIAENFFIITPHASRSQSDIPFTSIPSLTERILGDTLGKTVLPFGTVRNKLPGTIHSQPTDSLLKPMMHRSDNFFAEQSLLMVSNELLGVMNDSKIIDTLLRTDFRDLPQRPRWADGSGLSRYNLFTPQSMVAILDKMRLEFGMDRIKEVFPTGDEGTLQNYYPEGRGFIFAKTGTLSGVVALSGFLYTKKGRLLIFSVLVNNHQASATAVRRAIEKFITGLRLNH